MRKFKYTRVRRKQNIIKKIKQYLIEDSDKNLFPYFLKKSLLIAISFIVPSFLPLQLYVSKYLKSFSLYKKITSNLNFYF